MWATRDLYDYRSTLSGNTESVTFAANPGEIWYVMVEGVSSYSGVTLVAAAKTCTATPISMGQTKTGTLSTTDCRSPVRGSSYYADRFSFSGTAGRQVAILLTSSAFDTYLYLIGPTGVVVKEDDDGGGGSNSRIPSGSGYFSLPSTGTYLIEATSYNANNTGSYSLNLSEQTTVPPDLTSSATVSSSYTSGQSGVQIPVTVRRTGGNLTQGTYVHAKLYWSSNSTWDTGDSVLWSSNDSIPDFPNSTLNSGGSKTVTATVKIPSVFPGTYYIISYADAPTGSYPSGFHTESSETNNKNVYSVSVSSGGACTATPISMGQTKTGTLGTSDCRSPVRGSSYYADRFSFSGTAGRQVAILLTSSAFDTYLYLIGPTGVVVKEDDDGGGGGNSRIPPGSGYFSLPSTGAYIIEVTSYYTNTTGAYSLGFSGH